MSAKKAKSALRVVSDEVVATKNVDDILKSLDLSDLRAGTRAANAKGVVREQGFLCSHDRTQLYWQSWQPDSTKARATVVLMHGYGEHSSRYDHIAVALTRVGYNVIAIDARGHGRSTGIRAHVSHFDDYVSDLNLIKQHAEYLWPELPLFCLGHSNGGLITLQYAMTHPKDVRGFIVTSPYCGLRMKVPFAKALAGNILSKLWPSFSLPSGLDPAHVSRDTLVVQRYSTDPLVQGIATARWFTEAKNAFREVFEHADQIKQPFLFLVAGNDHLTDCSAAIRVFHRLGSRDREMEVYPEHYHEILNEETWPKTVRRIVEWIERH